MVEFDATGVRGSGELVQQNTATCASQTMSGAGPLGADFVIGLTGAEGNFTGTTPGPFALAGRFTAEVPANSSTPGNIDNGEVDANSPGVATYRAGRIVFRHFPSILSAGALRDERHADARRHEFQRLSDYDDGRTADRSFHCGNGLSEPDHTFC